jgi:hypothetical protein
MILEEINVGKDKESKEKVILENLGKQVILCDNHARWVHGLLSKENYDDTCYQIHLLDPRRIREFWYNDLQQLILLKAYRDNPLPEIKVENL